MEELVETKFEEADTTEVSMIAESDIKKTKKKKKIEPNEENPTDPKPQKKKKVKENKEENKEEIKPTTENLEEVNNKKKKKTEKKEEKSKIKTNTISVDADHKKVLDYMINQNRPYSTLNIFDNLHGTVKKKALERILDALSEDKELIMKEYNTKIYLVSQKHFPEVDKNELKQIDDETDKLKEVISELKEKSSHLQTELRQITSTLTDEELTFQIEQLTKSTNKLKESLKMWEDGAIERIPDDIINQTEKEYDRNKVSYKKIKKICLNILDTFCEGLEMKREEFMNLINGFENDTDVINLLKLKL